MAQRLATEYVKTCLELTEAQMSKFIQMFEDHQVTLHVKVVENGNQEIAFRDDEGEEVLLSFERQFNKFVCERSCRISSQKLANLMRKAISIFKGDAVVNRIYPTFTMVYHYHHGSVVKIVEVIGASEKIIYEYRNRVGQLEQLFKRRQVEREIAIIQDQVNHLLDLRNSVQEPEIHKQIDERLQKMSRRLFLLEA